MKLSENDDTMGNKKKKKTGKTKQVDFGKFRHKYKFFSIMSVFISILHFNLKTQA